MMGSEIFIIVALRCSEKSTSCFFASSICFSKNSLSAWQFMKEASRTSPSFSAIFSFSTVTEPSSARSSIRASVAAGITTDFSCE